MKKTIMKKTIILGVFLCWGLIGVGPVQAGSFTLDSTTDEVDSSPGDGLCVSSSGVCTLRAAIMEANALTGADDITVPAGVYLLTLTGTEEDAAATGDLDITDELTLVGLSHTAHASCTGPIIDAAAITERVFHVFASVTMEHLLVTGGAEFTGVWQMGGGIFFEGGAGRTITGALNRLRIIRNSASSGGGLAVLTRSGLGTADVTITESIIAENTAANGLAGALTCTPMPVHASRCLPAPSQKTRLSLAVAYWRRAGPIRLSTVRFLAIRPPTVAV